jgi:hypothetical protein
MPRLPDLNALGSRPVPQSQRRIASQDTTAAGRGMQQLGGTIGQVAEEVERRNDEQAVFEARRKLNDWERQKIFDPENGAVAKRGKDAFDLPKQLTEDFDKTASQISAGLGSNRQRQIFREMAEQRRNQVTSWADGHALKQRDVYEAGQYEADLKSFRDRAMLYADDPAKVATELAIQSERTTSYLRGKGRSEEEIAGAVKENASRVHTSAIASLMNRGEAEKAQDYLAKNEAGMTADDAQRARNALRETVARARAQTFADEMGDRPLAESLSLARERFTGNEEKEVVAELKTRAAEREAIKAQGYRENADSAWKVITAGGGKKQIPAVVWNGLAGEEQRQINDYLEAKWRRAKADAENKDVDPAVYYGLRMMAAEQPEVFAKLDLLKQAPYLSKQHENHLIELQAGINKGDLKAAEPQRTLKRTTDMLKNEIAAAGIDITLTDKDGNSKKAKETTAFLGAVATALDEATAAKGRALTDEEAKRIGMGMLREGIEQGSGLFGAFQTRKRGYQIATDPNIAPGASFVAARFDDIPEGIRNALATELRQARGLGTRPLTAGQEAEIERAYTRGVQQGRFR